MMGLRKNSDKDPVVLSHGWQWLGVSEVGRRGGRLSIQISKVGNTDLGIGIF